jgi:hypothetical protein
LAVPLVAVLAFQLRAVTWLGSLTPLQAFFVPLAPVAIAVVTLELLSADQGEAGSRNRSWWLLPTSLVLPALAIFVFMSIATSSSPRPSRWLLPYPWVDFTVVFICVVVAEVLFSRRRVWKPAWRDFDARIAIFLVTLLAAAFFAAEGFVFPPVTSVLDSVPVVRTWNWPSIPRSLPALVVVGLILMAVLRYSWPLDRVVSPGSEQLTIRVIALVLPLLVLALGVDAGLLRDYVHGPMSLAVPFLLTASLLLVVAIYRRLPDSRLRPNLWLIALAVAYPIWTLTVSGLTIDFRDFRLTGWMAALMLFAINIAYIVIAFATVHLGLDKVVVSAFRKMGREATAWSPSASHGLPLLLGITALSLLTAEFWEVSVEMTAPAFTAVLALLVGPVAIPLVAKTVLDVRQQVKTVPHGGDRTATTTPDRAADAPAPRSLQPVEWANALFISLAFNALALVVLGIASFLFFFLLAVLAVPSDVAATWVYGDGMERFAPRLENLSAFRSPWYRVPMLLAAFSVLYVFMSVCAAKDTRAEFFGWAAKALEECFRKRKLYREFAPGGALPGGEVPSRSATPAARGRP